MITFGSLFSGIGGFDLGMERAGLQAIWQCENNKDCQSVLKRHWPHTRLYNDVKEINQSNTATPDVIVGGFPCQDLSVAGKREGLAGERSGLWFEFHRIIAELKPRYAIIENVPGLLSSNSGEDFAVILRGLAECGYYAAWRVLDAQYFGLAQRRRRVFIVASLDGSCAEILFEREGGAWDSPPGREAGQGVTRAVAFSAGNSGDSYGVGYTEEGTPPLKAGESGTNQVPTVAFLPAIALSNRGGGNGQRAETLRSDSHGAIPMVAYGGNNTAGSIEIATAVNAHGSRRYDFESETFIASTLNSGGNNGGFRTEPGEHLVIGALDSGGSGGKNAHGGAWPGTTVQTMLAGQSWPTPFGVRRLTPVECERLQGFPDGFTDGQSDSARYRQLGNAVAVPCSEWIGRRIAASCA